MKSEEKNMLKGIGVCPGIVIGKAFLYNVEELCVIYKKIKKQDIKFEIERLKNAYDVVKNELKDLEEKSAVQLGKKHAKLFEAYRLILDDPIFKNDTITKIEKENVNAETAISETLQKVAKVFENFNDEYMKERGKEIMDIGKRIIKELLGMQHNKQFENPQDEKMIIVTNNLLPSDLMALLRNNNIGGFISAAGGKTSHVSIFARSMNLPCVVGLHDMYSKIKAGDSLILDGENGFVIINPDQSTIENYTIEKKRLEFKRNELKKLRDIPAVTRDGLEIKLMSNIEIYEEVDTIIENGGIGIGLYRTEYLFLNRKDFPSEDEQYEYYKRIVQKMMPFSVVIRTLDLGGDKLSSIFSHLNINHEKNPYMGLRSIRFSLKYPQFFIPQLKAIFRASVLGKVKILFPMITTVEEVIEIKKIIEKVKEELKSEKKDFYPDIEIGAMIEIPSAALSCDIIAKEIDFISIGTNDLIQYTLAIDRINENLSEFYEPMHISVLRLLDIIIKAAKKENKKVSMCGEMAGDPLFTRILIGLGLTELSMSPIMIPIIKKNILNCSYAESRKEIEEILQYVDKKKLSELLLKNNSYV